MITMKVKTNIKSNSKEKEDIMYQTRKKQQCRLSM